MPKERVQDEYGIVAQVSWSRDQHVQVATLHQDPKGFLEWCRAIVARADVAELDADARAAFWGIEDMGMFWTPNRNEINHLIRQLRRARDQAFGADA